ncbi:LOW QUALITY PROTEIN: uncharacterized protein FYN12_009999 [Phoenicopterus ruber ruber]
MGERLLVWTWILLPGCWALRGPAEVSGFPGGSVEVPCEYKPELVAANKYWCRGSSWFSCSILVQTTAPGDKAWGDRVSLRDDPTQYVFVVTMENLRVEDGDQYWCGIQLAWYDPMFPVMVSVLPVPTTPHYDLDTTQGEEATSAPTFPWTPLELENAMSTPKGRTLQAGTPNLLVLVLTPSAVLVLVLGIIIGCRMRKASLEKSRAWAVERKRAKDLQVAESWEQAAASSNTYKDLEWELSSPEGDYENSPAKRQGVEKEGLGGRLTLQPCFSPVLLCFFAVCQPLVVPREVSGRAGETLSFRCWYPRGYEGYNKYWCQGASWESCRKVVETAGREVPRQRGRVSIQDNHIFCVVRLTMEDLSEADAGSYWCAVERTGRDLMEPVTVRVVPAVSTTPAAPPATPTPWISTTAMELPPPSNATAVGPRGPALSALVPSVVLLSLLVVAGSAGLLYTLRRRREALADLHELGIATEPDHGSVYDNELDLTEGGRSDMEQDPEPKDNGIYTNMLR